MLKQKLPKDKRIVTIRVGLSGYNGANGKAAWNGEIISDEFSEILEYKGLSNMTSVPRAGLQSAIQGIILAMFESGKVSGARLEDIHFRLMSSSYYLYRVLLAENYKKWRLSKSGNFWNTKGSVSNQDLWAVLFILMENIDVSVEFVPAKNAEIERLKDTAKNTLMILNRGQLGRELKTSLYERPYNTLRKRKKVTDAILKKNRKKRILKKEKLGVLK